LHVLGFGLILLTLLMVVASFVPIGQLIVRILTVREPLKAYSVNVAGSLVGLWLYAVVSFLWLPPAWWFGVPLLLTVFLVRRHRRAWLTALGMTVLLTGVLAMPSQPGQVFWSPYQKLVLSTRTGEQGQYYHVDVNNTFYQTMEDIRGHPAPYRFPYQFVRQPARVLLVGAGAGNDAAEAVLQGAGHVDAVDIDPVILKLGQRLHPQRPYDSARVARILDDARAYFKKAAGPYDVIVYARLDSHTLLSGFTNVRLDHYVYTRESFEEAKRLLTPDGVLVLSFVSTEPWLEERLANTLKLVFGQEPLRVRPFTLVVGSQEKIHAALKRDADLAMRSTFASQQLTGEVRVPTDDWPYLYLKEPRIPSLHLLLSALVVVVVLGLLRGTGTALFQGGINWHFFFLGAAFLLLEFQGVSRFALLFGTTWFVNTVVISAFLCMILAANWCVTHRPMTSLTPYYAGLLGSVLLVLMPQQILLGAPAAIRGMLAGAIQAAPVFFAGMIFATSFRATPSVPAALGSNLLGAVFGGLLESLSYVMGITGLGWIVMALYGLSWLSLYLGQRLALTDTAGAPIPTEAACR
jgi:spermidine synthase